MVVNDTSLLTEETRKRLNESGLTHINTGGKPITEELVLELLEELQQLFKDDNN